MFNTLMYVGWPCSGDALCRQWLFQVIPCPSQPCPGHALFKLVLLQAIPSPSYSLLRLCIARVMPSLGCASSRRAFLKLCVVYFMHAFFRLCLLQAMPCSGDALFMQMLCPSLAFFRLCLAQARPCSGYIFCTLCLVQAVPCSGDACIHACCVAFSVLRTLLLSLFTPCQTAQLSWQVLDNSTKKWMHATVFPAQITCCKNIVRLTISFSVHAYTCDDVLICMVIWLMLQKYLSKCKYTQNYKYK